MDTADTKKKILVVEDEVLLRSSIRDVLASYGFSTLEAADGKQGLEVALREQPDLILLDIVMPVMDGWTMLEKLRQANAWGETVPVFMLTNLNSDNDEQMSKIAKFEPAYFLVKSNWSLEDIVKKINEQFSSSA